MSYQHLTALTDIDSELADRLEHDSDFRRRYIRKFAQAEVAAEIRLLRKKRKLKQGEVASLAHTGQSAISRIEKADYDGWTYKTLVGIAEALRARLRVRFEPIEDVAAGYRSNTDEADENDVAVLTPDVYQSVDMNLIYGSMIFNKTTDAGQQDDQPVALHLADGWQQDAAVAAYGVQ